MSAADEPEQVVLDKSVIRRTARARRRDLVACRDLAVDADRLAEHVVALVARHTGGRACRVAAYESYGVEPPTGRLVDRLQAAGHEVVLPLLLPDRSLEWVLAGGDGSALGVDALAQAAVVVTPGLAVDRVGTRMGQGGGSYDRALVHRRPGGLVVTLLHDGELCPPGTTLPHSELDEPVDAVVTADGGVVELH